MNVSHKITILFVDFRISIPNVFESDDYSSEVSSFSTSEVKTDFRADSKKLGMYLPKSILLVMKKVMKQKSIDFAAEV